MICIYHSRDLDGWMSAAIVKLKFPNVKLIGWDYGSVVPDVAFQEVIMVDISLSPMLMGELKNRTTWIDHHASAIKDAIDNNYSDMSGLRDPKFAACELTWKYFFPEQEMPEIVRLLGRYDCFGHKGTDEEQKVLEFQYGARSVISNPEDAYAMLIECTRTKESEYWFLQAQVVVGRMHELGRGIYKYLCTEAKQIYARKFDMRFAEPVLSTRDTNFPSSAFATRKFACVNQDRFNPINFGIDYHKDGYDGFCCFWYADGRWSFSLYNDNGEVDCSIIAKDLGGGGHKGAAGFTQPSIEEFIKHRVYEKES